VEKYYVVEKQDSSNPGWHITYMHKYPRKRDAISRCNLLKSMARKHHQSPLDSNFRVAKVVHEVVYE